MEAEGRDQRILRMGYRARQGGHGVVPMLSISVLIGQTSQGVYFHHLHSGFDYTWAMHYYQPGAVILGRCSLVSYGIWGLD